MSHRDEALALVIAWALLEAGADPNIRDWEGKTALFLRRSRDSEGQLALERLLIQYGADPTMRDDEGNRYQCHTEECRTAQGE